MRAKDYHKKGVNLRIRLWGYNWLTLYKLKQAMAILEGNEIPFEDFERVFLRDD